jgi:hypothetical protein
MTPGSHDNNQPGGTDRGDGVSSRSVVLQIAVDVSYRSIMSSDRTLSTTFRTNSHSYRRSCGLHRLIIQVAVARSRNTALARTVP